LKSNYIVGIISFCILVWGNVVAEGPDLRGLMLSGTEEDLGYDFPPGPWGLVMETGFPEGSYTLVALDDGTASIYFSEGGGVIGAGEYPRVASAAKTAVQTAAENIQLFTLIDSALPPPPAGLVTLYIRSGKELFMLSAEEDQLGDGKHSASSIFYAAHDVITEIRQQEEQGGT
jgi:hypothetical protein